MVSLSDGIVSHLKKQAGPASVELKTEADFTKYVGDRDASVVGRFCLKVEFCMNKEYQMTKMSTFCLCRLICDCMLCFLCLSCPGFFADDGSPAKAEFLKSASALRESFRFAHTNSGELLQKNGVEGE